MMAGSLKTGPLRELINLMGYAYDGTPEGLRALSQALPAVALSPLHP